MKGNSNHYPELTKQSAGLTQVRYDIVEVIKEEMDGTSRTSYDFTYVNVDEPTRSKIIDAIITNIYSKDAELAMINNELESPGTTAYAEYQALRAYAKEIAQGVLA